jgi:hypothetical protein
MIKKQFGFNTNLPFNLANARRYLYLWHEQVHRLQEAKRRRAVFKEALEKFMTNPRAVMNGNDDVLPDLIYGWGNKEWSALDLYLRECLCQAAVANSAILECGSGLSTILLGVVAQQTGNTVWTLEHNRDWASRTARVLRRMKISSVHMMLAPLKAFGDFTWYDAPLNTMPNEFSIVVCDGPPANTIGGRYGLLPVMNDKLKAGCVILLDDTDRAEDRAIGIRWSDERNGRWEMRGARHPYMIISLPD